MRCIFSLSLLHMRDQTFSSVFSSSGHPKPSLTNPRSPSCSVTALRYRVSQKLETTGATISPASVSNINHGCFFFLKRQNSQSTPDRVRKTERDERTQKSSEENEKAIAEEILLNQHRGKAINEACCSVLSIWVTRSCQKNSALFAFSRKVIFFPFVRYRYK